jgi:transposase
LKPDTSELGILAMRRNPLARQSKHPEEFQRQAAALVLDSGRSIRDVARELGVNHETLRNWVAKLRQERAGEQPGGLGPDERSELLRLRRQVAQLELEKEILKKAAVFFARETER